MAESSLTRLLRGAGTLLGGNAAGALLAFVATLITARALGPEDLGAIVLVQAFVLGVDKLVNFQSWRAIIRYGSDALEADDPRAFARVLKFGLVVDAATATAAALLAAAGSFWMARAFEWSPTLHLMCVLYAATLVVNISGAPIAVLRMYDRFRAFAIQRTVVGVTKVALVAVCAVFGASAPIYLAAWMIADVLGYLTLLAIAARVYRAEGGSSLRHAPIAGIRDAFPGIVGFLLSTNAATALRLVTREADVFIVGAWLGDAAVGLYKIARQFASLPAQAYDPLSHVVYPELARQTARRDVPAFLRTLRQSAALATGIAVCALIGTWTLGEWAIITSVGPAYESAAPILMAYVSGVAVNLATFFLNPAAMALDRPRASLHGVAIASIAYFLALFPLIDRYGVVGAGWAQLVLSVTLSGWIAVEVVRAFTLWRNDGGRRS